MWKEPKNGRTKNPLYVIWSGMQSRCRNPNSVGWKHYGGRGIKVCDRWVNSFTAFVTDMGPRPPKYTIERIDNDGDYEPGNCKWASRTEQAFNKRNTRILEIDGERMNLLQASERFGLRYHLMLGRSKQGYSDRQIVGLDPLPGIPGVTPAKEAYWAKRREHWDSRTVCPNGHPWTKENELWEKNGSRKCRQCHNERRRSKALFFEKKRAAIHCVNGHEWATNTKMIGTKRVCLICVRESSKLSTRRSRERAKHGEQP